MIVKGRRQAHPDKGFALFLIGMRVNRLAAIGTVPATARMGGLRDPFPRA